MTAKRVAVSAAGLIPSLVSVAAPIPAADVGVAARAAVRAEQHVEQQDKDEDGGEDAPGIC
jgi:hypothetical protein